MILRKIITAVIVVIIIVIGVFIASEYNDNDNDDDMSLPQFYDLVHLYHYVISYY